MGSIFGERAANTVSPSLLLVAALCFLLPFAAVSCDTAKVRGDPRLAGVPPAARTVIDRCIDAVKGRHIIGYSGYDLVAGADPTVETGGITACNPRGADAASQATGTIVNIGHQGPLVAALAVLVLGMVVAVLPFRGRGYAVAAICAAAIALLAAGFARIQGEVSDRLGTNLQSLLGQGTSLLPPDAFVVTPSYGLWLSAAVIAVAAAYNVVVELAGRRHPPPASGGLPWGSTAAPARGG